MTAALPVLPPNWAAFVDAVILGDDPVTAAKALGYQHPNRAAVELIRHPQVRKALATAAECRLEGVAVPMALATVEEILQDQSAPKAVRAKLALGILDRVRSKEDKTAAAGKPLQELSMAELGELIAKVQASTPGVGQMLNITPDGKPAA